MRPNAPTDPHPVRQAVHPALAQGALPTYGEADHGHARPVVSPYAATSPFPRTAATPNPPSAMPASQSPDLSPRATEAEICAAATTIAEHTWSQEGRMIDYLVSPELADGGDVVSVRVGPIELSAFVLPDGIRPRGFYAKAAALLSCGFARLPLQQRAQTARLYRVRRLDGNEPTEDDRVLSQQVVDLANERMV